MRKQFKSLIFGLAVGMSILTVSNVSAEISQTTQNYLSGKNFSAAKSSIENDLKQDSFDAKSWYFYSRILYQTDQPRAAKKALNNALNIDKTASFDKNGMSDLKKFAGAITAKIKSTNNESSVSMPTITSSSYNSYLASVFGKNNPYSNTNPPSSMAIQTALNNKHSSVKTSVDNSQHSVPSNGINNNFSQKNENNSTTSAKQESKTEGKSHSGFILGLLFLLLVAGVIYFFTKRKNQSLENNGLKDKIVEEFNSLKSFTSVVEEKLKDYEILIPNTKVLSEMSKLYTGALDFFQNIDLNDVSTSNLEKIKNFQSSMKEKYDVLEKCYNEHDYDFVELFKQKELEAQKENARKEKEQEEKRLRQEKELEREAELEKARIQSGYYERKREQELEAQRERQREREREYERERQYERERAFQQQNSSSSRMGDMAIGALGYHVAEEMLESHSERERDRQSEYQTDRETRMVDNDDDNSNIWEEQKGNEDDSNSSFWDDSSNNNDDDNSSVWDDSDNSNDGDSDDSNNW